MAAPSISVHAVILDMDGLMLDTEGIYKRAWQAAAGECGYDLDDGFYLTLVGRPLPACEAALARRFGSEFPMPAFRAAWEARWREEVVGAGIPAKPGLAGLLAWLAERGIPAAVATSSDREYAGLCLRTAGLEGRFDVIVTGDEIARGKPAPDIYLEAARRLGVEPSLCAALEDSDAGILAAHAAGMTAVMVPDLKPPSAAARAAARCVAGSLAEARAWLEGALVSPGKAAP